PAAEAKAPSSAIARAVARGGRATAFEAPQYGANAREQFTQVERLGQIVVGAEFKADDAVDIVAAVARGEDDPEIGVGANFSKQIQPVLLAKLKIENHQVDLFSLELTGHLFSVGSDDCSNVVFGEII